MTDLVAITADLQTAFVKCLHDAARPVGDRAAAGIEALAAVLVLVDRTAAGPRALVEGVAARAIIVVLNVAIRLTCRIVGSYLGVVMCVFLLWYNHYRLPVFRCSFVSSSCSRPLCCIICEARVS